LLQREPARRAPAAWLLAEHKWVRRGAPTETMVSSTLAIETAEITSPTLPSSSVEGACAAPFQEEVIEEAVVDMSVDVPVFIAVPVSVNGVSSTSPPDALAAEAARQMTTSPPPVEHYAMAQVSSATAIGLDESGGRDQENIEACGANIPAANIADEAEQFVVINKISVLDISDTSE